MPEGLNPSGAPQSISPFMGLCLGFGPQTSSLWKHSADLYVAYVTKLKSARTPADILLANAHFMVAGLAELSRFRVDLSRPASRRGRDSAG